MGQRDAFSAQDIQKINKMYKCSNIENVDEEKAPLNAHNNIDELIGEIENEITTTTGRPSSPNPTRPNRPLLNLFGSLISQAFNQG